MNPIEFTTEQYNQMSRPQKASLLVDSINNLNNNTIVMIDDNNVNTLSDFVSWLLQNE